MNVRLSRNADGTITVRVGRSVEHIDTFGKTKAQVYDALRWALISKNATLSEIQITEELHRLLGAS